MRILLIPFFITFLNPKILGFLFSTKNSPTRGVKCEKSNYRKSQAIYQIGFENCTLWYSHLEIFVFSRPKVIEESRQYLPLQTDILQKTVAFLLSRSYFCAPLIAFNARKTHLGMYIFSNFTMFVKQILKDSPMNLKNCISSYFLCYSPVREFIATKVRLSSLFGYSHCSKSLKTITDHLMHRYEAKISDSKRKKPDS